MSDHGFFIFAAIFIAFSIWLIFFKELASNRFEDYEKNYIQFLAEHLTVSKFIKLKLGNLVELWREDGAPFKLLEEIFHIHRFTGQSSEQIVRHLEYEKIITQEEARQLAKESKNGSMVENPDFQISFYSNIGEAIKEYYSESVARYDLPSERNLEEPAIIAVFLGRTVNSVRQLLSKWGIYVARDLRRRESDSNEPQRDDDSDRLYEKAKLRDLSIDEVEKRFAELADGEAGKDSLNKIFRKVSTDYVAKKFRPEYFERLTTIINDHNLDQCEDLIELSLRYIRYCVMKGLDPEVAINFDVPEIRLSQGERVRYVFREVCYLGSVEAEAGVDYELGYLFLTNKNIIYASPSSNFKLGLRSLMRVSKNDKTLKLFKNSKSAKPYFFHLEDIEFAQSVVSNILNSGGKSLAST
jgi:hypothetical protein